MQAGLITHVVYSQRQPCFVAADGLMLCAMIGKYALHFLHTGNKQHIRHEDNHSNQTFQQVQSQCTGNDTIEKAANNHRQQEEQADGHSHTQKHRKSGNKLLERFITQLFVYDLLQTKGTNTTMYNGGRTVKWEIEPCRSIQLTLRYVFNQAKSKYKGTGAGASQKARM